MTQSYANCSLRTCQPVDAHTALDRAVVDGSGRLDEAAVDDVPYRIGTSSNDVLEADFEFYPVHTMCD